MAEDQQSNFQESKNFQERKQGVGLAIWLILLLLGNIDALIVMLLSVRVVSQVTPGFFTGISMYIICAMMLFIFLSIVSLIFLFLWKKWAFFMLCGNYFIILVITIFVLPIFGLILGIGMTFALGILYLLLRPKWQFLE